MTKSKVTYKYGMYKDGSMYVERIQDKKRKHIITASDIRALQAGIRKCSLSLDPQERGEALQKFLARYMPTDDQVKQYYNTHLTRK